MKAGGFSGVYNGVMATALGAAPGAAFFFSAYEGMKPQLRALNGGKERRASSRLAHAEALQPYLRKQLLLSPAGIDDDDFILRVALEHDATVLSTGSEGWRMTGSALKRWTLYF